ncbi:hypothetical protein QUA54_30560 [Microcoleus sp. MOSTC5]
MWFSRKVICQDSEQACDRNGMVNEPVPVFLEYLVDWQLLALTH